MHRHVVVQEHDAQVPVMLSAVSISRLDAITMTRLAPSSATSSSRWAAASPEPKLTRCGRVSWTKRMPNIFPLAAEDARL